MDLGRDKVFSSNAVRAKSFVKPKTIPPISSALKFHSYQTYYQLAK